MTTKTKTTVSAAIDAINEVASPLDFSFKALAELQGLFVFRRLRYSRVESSA